MGFSYGLKDESYKHIHGDRVYYQIGKIFDSSHIYLVAAKGDWAAFQVLIMRDEDFTLSVDNNPVFSPLGTLENVRLEASIEEGFENFCLSMNLVGLAEDDDRLFKSDILLHDGAIHVKKNEVQPVWVEIKVSDNVSAGNYKGQVRLLSHTMFGDEEQLGILIFELEILEVTIDSDTNFSNVMRTGQITSVALSFFIGLALIENTSKFKAYFMDDPIQNLDDVNILSLVELMRTQLKSKNGFAEQLFITTCDEDFEQLLKYKMVI